MAIVALFGAMQLAVSYVSLLAGLGLSMLLGPMAVFVLGIADQGVPALLLAALVVLVPRVGTAAWLLLTVFLLNTLLSGIVGVPSLLFIAVSIVAHEGLLAALGVTTSQRLSAPRQQAATATVVRVALAIGTSRALVVAAQWLLARVLYRLIYPDWYIASLALVTGLGCGALGAAFGTRLGYRLRRVAE